MTKPIIIAFAIVASLLVVEGVEGPSLASAQDVQITGPLAGAPACRNCRIYRDGRIMLSPTVSFTLQDEYSRSIFVGLNAQYHFTDWLGLGVWGAYNPAKIDTGLTAQVTANGQTTDRNVLSLPNAAEFTNQISRLTAVAALQLTFIPLRGKLSLFQNLFVDTDFYIFAGAAMIVAEQRAEIRRAEAPGCTTDPPPAGGPAGLTTACGQIERDTLLDFTWTAGVGLSMYFNDWIGLALEWRALPFAWNTSGTDEKNAAGESFPDGAIDGNDNIYRLNHMFTAGIVFMLPTTAGISE